MKRLIFSLVFVTLAVSGLHAQDATRMPASDRLILTAFTDIWSGLPDGMSTQVINRGFGFDYLQEWPLGTSNFSAAAGVGFMFHNLYSDHIYFDPERSGSHDFLPVSEIYSNEYSTNKLSLNYLNVPLEIRFRTRNAQRTFRIHAGVKAGLLIDAHTKFTGEYDSGGRDVKIKEKKLENIENFLVGFHARIGYGRVNVNTFIPLTNVFSNNSAQPASFMSVGLSFIVF
jgi:hypothetical protein